MIIRNLTSTGDWTFGSGQSDYLRDLPALKLNLRTRLKSWRGDCFYAPAEGVDWNNFLDIGTKDFLDRDIKRVILQTEGVLKITEYTSTLDRDDRDVSINCTITTIFGTITIQEVL
jgi:hypothetical protein